MNPLDLACLFEFGQIAAQGGRRSSGARDEFANRDDGAILDRPEYHLPAFAFVHPILQHNQN